MKGSLLTLCCEARRGRKDSYIHLAGPFLQISTPVLGIIGIRLGLDSLLSWLDSAPSEYTHWCYTSRCHTPVVCIVGMCTTALHSKELSLLRLRWETSLPLLAFVPQLSACFVELNGGLVLFPLYYWGTKLFFFRVSLHAAWKRCFLSIITLLVGDVTQLP